jgi:hypothetical protein
MEVVHAVNRNILLRPVFSRLYLVIAAPSSGVCTIWRQSCGGCQEVGYLTPDTYRAVVIGLMVSQIVISITLSH